MAWRGMAAMGLCWSLEESGPTSEKIIGLCPKHVGFTPQIMIIMAISTRNMKINLDKALNF